jgi:hypothetical protein
MAATISTTRRTRTASPARWQKALKHAFDQGVTVRQLQCGVWVATSGADATSAYAVTLHDCECRAAQEGDPVCKHRATLAYTLSHLAPEPEPPAPDPLPANVVPFPAQDERDATTDRAIAYIERMAARHGDEPADFGIAA